MFHIFHLSYISEEKNKKTLSRRKGKFYVKKRKKTKESFDPKEKNLISRFSKHGGFFGKIEVNC